MIWNEPYNNEEVFIVTQPTRIFNLNHKYHPGLGDLTVLLNGVGVFKDRDYIEENSLTIQFTYDIEPKDVVIFRFQNLRW